MEHQKHVESLKVTLETRDSKSKAGCFASRSSQNDGYSRTISFADAEEGKDDGEELLKRTEACLVKLGVDKSMFRSALDKLKKQHGGDIAAVQEDLAFEFSSALNNVVGIGSGPPVPGAGDDVL